MTKSARTIFQFVALVLLLIVFPAASWYYLNSGLQYRRAAMSELKDYGNFPLGSWSLADGSPLTPGILEKKMLVANILPAEQKSDLMRECGEALQKLHEQFAERDELLFVTIVQGDSTGISRQTAQFAQGYALDKQKHQFFVGMNEQELAALEEDIFQQDMLSGTDPEALFLLTDTTATIRRYYNLRESQDIKRLVEHIALLLPLKKDRELIFKREVEK